MEKPVSQVSSRVHSREGSPWHIAARRLLRDKLSVISLLFIGIVTIMAMFGYVIAPDSTPNANNQHLELATRHPGFSVQMLRVPAHEPGKKTSPFLQLFRGKPLNYKEIPIQGYELAFPNLILHHYSEPEDSVSIKTQHPLRSILFPQVPPESITFFPNAMRVHDRIYSEEETLRLLRDKHIHNRVFLLGTDRFGRDLLSRLILGASISLSVGFIAVAISLLIGIALGAMAGYFRGWFDDAVMWLVNVVWSIPTLLMVIAITMVLGKGFWQIFVAVGLTMWVEVARVVRGQVLSLREKEFVEAARVMGFSPTRIIFHHILPNLLGPVIIISAGNFATAILLEAGLSFLGIGVQPPTPSWGTMIRDHYGYIIMDKAFLAILPGVAIMLLVLAFTILGNGLRDALDPKGDKI